MRKLTLLHLIVVAVALAVCGGLLYVEFRAWRGDEDPNVLYLLALGIGTLIGLVANHRRYGSLVVFVAVACAVGCCLIGNFRIAILERSAIAHEFDRDALYTDDFFIALEAYLSKHTGDGVAPPFTGAASRSHYSDSEWFDAERRWRDKTDIEQESARKKWRSDYANLSRIGDEGVVNVFLAPWNWFTYTVAATIAAGIVIVIQRDERNGKARQA